MSRWTLCFVLGEYAGHPLERSLIDHLGWDTLLGRRTEHLSLDGCIPFRNRPAPTRPVGCMRLIGPG